MWTPVTPADDRSVLLPTGLAHDRLQGVESGDVGPLQTDGSAEHHQTQQALGRHGDGEGSACPPRCSRQESQTLVLVRALLAAAHTCVCRETRVCRRASGLRGRLPPTTDGTEDIPLRRHHFSPRQIQDGRQTGRCCDSTGTGGLPSRLWAAVCSPVCRHLPWSRKCSP